MKSADRKLGAQTFTDNLILDDGLLRAGCVRVLKISREFLGGVSLSAPVGASQSFLNTSRVTKICDHFAPHVPFSLLLCVIGPPPLDTEVASLSSLLVATL